MTRKSKHRELSNSDGWVEFFGEGSREYMKQKLRHKRIEKLKNLNEKR